MRILSVLFWLSAICVCAVSRVHSQESSSGEEVSSTGGEAAAVSSSSSSGAAATTCIDKSVPGAVVPDATGTGTTSIYEGTYTCGCYTSVTTNVTDPISGEPVPQTTAGTPTYYDGREWDANWQDETPWLGASDANLLDARYSDSSSSVAANASARGYPQCYGSSTTSNCFDHFRGEVQSQSSFAGGFFCEGTVGNPDFVKGDDSPPICVVYGGGNKLYKMRFYPIVDQFALITIQGSFNTTAGWRQMGHIGTSFQVEVNGYKTPTKHRYGTLSSSECVDPVDSEGNPLLKPGVEPRTPMPCSFGSAVCTVVPFHTIVIHLVQGKISYIEFDDDDSLCSNDLSIDGNCAIPITSCVSSQSYDKSNTAAETDCDFKVYVSWEGTDKENTFLTSAGRRLSQFRRWSLNAVYNQASQFDSKDLPSVPSGEE